MLLIHQNCSEDSGIWWAWFYVRGTLMYNVHTPLHAQVFVEQQTEYRWPLLPTDRHPTRIKVSGNGDVLWGTQQVAGTKQARLPRRASGVVGRRAPCAAEHR